jgi:hypothetical protein
MVEIERAYYRIVDFLAHTHKLRHGTLLVTHGKTAAARRVLPMTLRVRNILETRWERIGKPSEGWVWTANT